MAADVLAYRAHEVPVGEDQREHIELMRDVAEDFNKRFGETLVVPEGNIPTVGARVRDLQEPEKKMSTTGGTPKGTVYVDEEPDAIVKKFKRAADRLGRGDRARATTSPGITNLIEILAVVRGVDAGGDRARVRGLAATATSRPPSARRSPTWLTPGARALPGAARGHGGDRGDPRGRRREGAGDRRPASSPTCARRWASVPSVRPAA